MKAKKLTLSLPFYFNLTAFVFSLVMANLASANSASPNNTSKIEITQAWVRAVPPVVKTTAAYLTMINHSQKDIEITNITSPQFSMVEAHNTIITNGLAQMVSAEKLVIAAQSKLIFKPEGLHLMMMMSKISIEKGAIVQITFTFSDGTKMVVDSLIK